MAEWPENEETDLASHPYNRLIDAQQSHSLAMQQVYEARTKPTFAVGLDYILTGKRTDADPQYNGRDALMPRASIRIPVHKAVDRAGAQEQKVRALPMEADRERQVQAFGTEALTARNNYDLSILDQQSYTEQKAVLEGAQEVLAVAYSNDTGGIEQWLSIQAQLIETELNLLSSIVNSRLALAQYRRIIN